MSILVIAEHDNTVLKPVTLNVLGAACQIGEEITLLVAGYQSHAVVTAAKSIPCVKQVLHVDHLEFAHGMAEPLSELIVSLASEYQHILAAATTTGKNFLPRVAALLDVSQISEIVAIESADTFKRPIYAGNAIATVQSVQAKHLLTVRGSSFDAVVSTGGEAKVSVVSQSLNKTWGSEFVEALQAESDRPELTAAKVIISGGRGMGSGESFELLNKVADKLGAAVGASRAAVDAGFVPNDMQVGQTGKIVAPDLYIAVGISGAIQHLAGMKDSGVIVAINKDEEAPIFQVADYGLVADLFVALPELEHQL